MSLINLLRKKYKTTLFTTPSHGQKFFIFNKFQQFYKYDVSETDTHCPQEALYLAQERAKTLYGVNHTNFLTNGSTSGIIASVLACVKSGENVLLHSDAHHAHLNAVKLAGATPQFYELPEIQDWGIYGKTTVELLEEHFKNKKIKALIVTSPSYEGIVSDINAIKNLCKKYNAYLIVDEAHGALYPFCNELPKSAVRIADFTIQSLHKTAGGLNPTALLHSNCEINPTNALEMISTTSPSYSLLASIEANINYLNSERGQKTIKELIENIKTLRRECTNIEFFGDDITKILIKVKGLSGFELSEKLFEKFCIEDERTNEKSSMLLCGIGTDIKKLNRLKSALKHFK